MLYNLVWTIHKEVDFELFGFAKGILDRAIEDLKTDGELSSAVFVVTKEDVHCLEVWFQGQVEKQELYMSVIEFARTQNAEVIVTLNDAYWGPPESAENYYPGKLREEYGTECIQVTVSGPGLKNWEYGVHYTRKSGKFLFQMPYEDFGGQIGFLDGWADNLKSVN